MENKLKETLASLLKQISDKKICETIELKNINYDKTLILNGILFDNENTCYYSYDKLEDIVDSLIVSANNCGIYLENEFIGIISSFYKYYKDLSKLEIMICIRKEYRNKKIGEYFLDKVIYDCFKKSNIKSIHLSIREDNIKSRRMAEKLGFKLYKGYKFRNVFIDENGNIKQNSQYLLKKKDYKKL